MVSVKLGCVVMAAGNARRFGENKLAAELGGVSLARRALLAVPGEEFAAVAVVTQYQETAELAERFGFQVVWNRRPDLGQSHTIQLGLEALGDMDAAMFLVADQPLLRRETVAALIAFYREEPKDIAALSHGGQRGNPVVFPGQYFPELIALEGDRGGGAVIRRHGECLRLLEAPAEELLDVDTPEELRKLKKE